jgi:FKBP-type peptidyl-prolyl cis-trans isomerase
MTTRVTRTAVLCVLSLAACSQRIEEPEGPAPTPTSTSMRPEMIESFVGMDLRRELPEKLEDHPDLRVQVLAPGDGEAIHYGMIGRFHYIASLGNGSVVHGTYEGDDPKPEVLRLLPPAVPKGLALALDGCKVGERRLVTIPSGLAYGDAGDFSHEVPVPPRATLVYEIELVQVVHDVAIKVLQEGGGEELTYGRTGKFNYTGVLAADGKVFDTTENGPPRQFAVRENNVIAGWVLGLPGMKVGEKRRLRIPAEFAYGEQGRPEGGIGPNADLVFDVQLVELVAEPGRT